MNKCNLHELSSGNYFTGIAGNSGTGVLEPLGNVLHTQSYKIDTILFLQSVKKYTDNEFAFVGEYMKDTCSISPPNLVGNPLIGRMDSLGNTYGVHYYSMNAPSCGFLCRDLEVTSNNDVIAWGSESFFALRVDAVGAVQWAKWFDHEGGFRFFKELPGGDLIAGINMDTAGVVVARMDPQGNFLWCKSYIRPRGMIADCVVESDDAFVITGYTDSTASNDPFTLPPNYHPKLFMMKLNGSGEVQWCKGYDNEPYRWYVRAGGAFMARTLDGNYAVLANLGWEGYNIPYRPFLMKTDQNGDTLWTRSAGRHNFAYEIWNFLACSDGGFMYDGQGYELGAYIFKTDSLGYLPCYNQWHEVVISDLFPTDSSFTLTSIDGAVMRPAFVTDTVYDPVEVIEPCATSAPAQPTVRPDKRKMSVRPNPNTGRFTVAFTDPLAAETYYSVFDTMGKLLYQRPLPQGKTTEEVDLSRYGRGSYVIRCTDRVGVCYERVVVE